MLDSVTIAAANVRSIPGATSQNLEKILHLANRAAQSQAKLALFPELSLTGFLPNHPTGNHSAWLREALQFARRTAEPITGSAVKTLTMAAQQIGIYIAVGILEDAGNMLFNTQILVGPQGLIGSWRKMHVPMFEMPFYNGGPGPMVVDTPLGRIGANICFDALIPESTRLLAVQNVEIVLFPFAADPPPVTPAGWSAWAGPALRARCQENGVYGIAANYLGHVNAAGVDQTFPGGALVVGPRGETLAEQSNGDLLLHELRADDLLAARAEPEYLFRFRRPELYGPLAH